MCPDAVWQGRLAMPLDPRAQRLNDSLAVDGRLWPEELALTRAYAPSLVDAGVLTASEAEALVAAAASLEADLLAGTVALAGEDVHTAVEAELTARCGDPARRLHTGRSRNDQVATLLRMRAMQLCEASGRARARAGAGAAAASARRARHHGRGLHASPAGTAGAARALVARAPRGVRARRGSLPRGARGGRSAAARRWRHRRHAAHVRSRRAGDRVSGSADSPRTASTPSAIATSRSTICTPPPQLGVHLSRLAEDLVLWCSPGFGWFTRARRVLDRIEPAAAEAQPRSVRAGARQERQAAGERAAARDRCSRVCRPRTRRICRRTRRRCSTPPTRSAWLLAALPPAIAALAPRLRRWRRA